MLGKLLGMSKPDSLTVDWAKVDQAADHLQETGTLPFEHHCPREACACSPATERVDGAAMACLAHHLDTMGAIKTDLPKTDSSSLWRSRLLTQLLQANRQAGRSEISDLPFTHACTNEDQTCPCGPLRPEDEKFTNRTKTTGDSTYTKNRIQAINCLAHHERAMDQKTESRIRRPPQTETFYANQIIAELTTRSCQLPGHRNPLQTKSTAEMSFGQQKRHGVLFGEVASKCTMVHDEKVRFDPEEDIRTHYRLQHPGHSMLYCPTCDRYSDQAHQSKLERFQPSLHSALLCDQPGHRRSSSAYISLDRHEGEEHPTSTSYNYCPLCHTSHDTKDEVCTGLEDRSRCLVCHPKKPRWTRGEHHHHEKKIDNNTTETAAYCADCGYVAFKHTHLFCPYWNEVIPTDSSIQAHTGCTNHHEVSADQGDRARSESKSH